MSRYNRSLVIVLSSSNGPNKKKREVELLTINKASNEQKDIREEIAKFVEV